MVPHAECVSRPDCLAKDVSGLDPYTTFGSIGLCDCWLTVYQFIDEFEDFRLCEGLWVRRAVCPTCVRERIPELCLAELGPVSEGSLFHEGWNSFDDATCFVLTVGGKESGGYRPEYREDGRSMLSRTVDREIVIGRDEHVGPFRTTACDGEPEFRELQYFVEVLSSECDFDIEKY